MKNSYSHLNDQIAKFIVKMGGLDKAIEFLDDVLLSENDSTKRTSLFINFSVANYFSLTVEELIGDQSNAQCRNVCYILHKEFLELSIRKTGAIYRKKENAVLMGLKRINDIIKDPSLDPEVYECYLQVKKQTQKFDKYLSSEKENK
jgi:chromosomal replication initiation ATPase DnaA